jgi:predicted dehydrogenase
LHPLGVAVVGLGWWGRIVVSLLRNDPKLTAVRGVDPAPAAAELGRSLGLQMGSFEEALADPAVGGVILCTPHSQHCEQIIAAAKARKHVFCEKPLSLSRSDALRAVKACNENEVVLAVGHEKRFEPPVQEVFRAARAGELGTLLQIKQEQAKSQPNRRDNFDQDVASDFPIYADFDRQQQ